MPATTVETLIYKLETEDNANKIFKETAKTILSVEKALKSLTNALSFPTGLLTTLGKIGIDAFKSMAKASTDFVIDSIKNFANYEDILTHAARTLSLTKEEALDLGKALTDMALGALKGGVASEELAKLAGAAGQLGVAKEDVLEFVEIVAKMGRAFGISGAQAAEGMQILSNIFRLNMEEMERLGSGITVLGNSTAATADQIIRSSQKMAGVAEFFGLSAGKTAALSATLRDLGVTVGVSASSMNRFLGQIMSDHTKFAEVLGLNAEQLLADLESNDPSQALFTVLEAINQINAQGGKIAAAEALKDLGMNAVRTKNAVLLLAGATDKLRENIALEAQAEQENTAITKAYSIAIDTATGRWNAFKEAISALAKTIGGPLATALSEFLDDYITPIIESFTKWLENSELFNKFMGEILPNTLNKLGEIITDLAKNMFDFLLEADRGVENVIERFRQWWQEHLPKVKQFLTDIVDVFRGLPNIIDTIQNALLLIRDTTSMWTEDLKAAIGWLKETTQGAANFFKKFTKGSDDSNVALRALEYNLGRVDDAILKAEEDSTGNSLFPDMVSWAELATGSICQLMR
jgi:TP901 family phage tail tape measure protein